MGRFLAFIGLCLMAVPGWSADRCAADENGYQSVYSIALLDSGDTCSGSNDTLTIPDDCDVEYDSGDSEGTIESGMNGATDTSGDGQIVSCITAGEDMTSVSWSSGGLELTVDGNSSVRRWLLPGDGASNVDKTWLTTHPYSDAGAPILENMELDGAAYWIVAGFEFDCTALGATNCIRLVDTNTDNNIIAYNHIHDFGNTSSTTGGRGIAVLNADFTTVEYNVVNDAKQNADTDNDSIYLQGGAYDTTIVNNEVFNCAGDCVVIADSGNTNLRTIIENNDLYQTSDNWTDCEGGAWDADGDSSDDCIAGENAIDIKAGNATSATDGPLILHNRAWGFRPGDDKSGGSGNRDGDVFNCQDDCEYARYQQNIIADSTQAMKSGGTTAIRVTVENNIFEVINTAVSDPGNQSGAADNNILQINGAGAGWLIQFNTLVGAASIDDGYYNDSANDHDVGCNVFKDVPTNDPGANDVIDYNMYLDSSGATMGESNPGTNTYTVAASNMDDFTYYRKLLTGSETDTIADVIPTSSTPWLNDCGGYSPGSGYGAD